MAQTMTAMTATEKQNFINRIADELVGEGVYIPKEFSPAHHAWCVFDHIGVWKAEGCDIFCTADDYSITNRIKITQADMKAAFKEVQRRGYNIFVNDDEMPYRRTYYFSKDTEYPYAEAVKTFNTTFSAW